MNDLRIPVRLARSWTVAEPGTLLLADSEARLSAPAGSVMTRFGARAAHRAACACCAGRPPFATALGGLFVARARGGRVFDRVIALSDEAGLRAASEALGSDPFLLARYREEA